jgi:hypothetical protein
MYLVNYMMVRVGIQCSELLAEEKMAMDTLHPYTDLSKNV